MNIVVLPGLDGTGRLLVPFASQCNARVIAYPTNRELTLDEYVEHAQIENGAVLIAESFSGPIAVRIAARRSLAALVLVGSFVTPPLPRALRLLPLATMARLQLPDWVLSLMMLSPYTTPERMRELRDAIGAVHPRVLASRMRIALSVDERMTLARTNVPLLDLRGRRDRLVLANARGEVVKQRRDATVADIEGPHALLYTRSEECWEVIARWLASRVSVAEL
ncbi:MAG TPA: alpha/beta hydrolase [Thermoanaerobaculia bacterium]|jgi:pimeloyl-ACP methyl ester carboxylesterase